MKILCLSTLFIFLVSCSGSVADLALEPHDGEVNLIKQVPGDWEKVCIFTPYTTGSAGEDISGIDSSRINSTGIYHSDSFNVLAFINPDESYAMYKVSMRDVVFIYTEPKCFSRDSSSLRAK